MKGARMRPTALVIRIAILIGLLASSGCAGWVRYELPDELKDKKLKEDPPVDARLKAGFGRA